MRTRATSICVAACVLLLDGRAAALHAPVGGALSQARPVGTQGHGPQHHPALSQRGGAEGSKEDQIQVRRAHCPGTGAGHNGSAQLSLAC
jgi:hypothetical protein